MSAHPTNLVELQTAILDLVAPPNWRQMQIVTATVHLPAGNKLPRLTLVCEGDDEDRGRLFAYNMTVTPRPRLDLDRMAAEACERGAAHTARAAFKAREYIAWNAARLIREANERHDDYLHAHRMRQISWAVERAVERFAGKLASGGVFPASTQGGFPLGPLAIGVSALQGHFGPELVYTHQPKRAPWWRRWIRSAAPAAAGTICLALILGWLGPALDGMEDHSAEWAEAARIQEQLQRDGEIALLEAEARAKCAAITGENGSYIPVQGGGIVCTDKRGRRVKGAL